MADRNERISYKKYSLLTLENTFTRKKSMHEKKERKKLS
jgi:hypothetical protein